ncbi:ninja-family protein AFP3-like [Populus alba x Populus x berolinensis]|nr:ninja-family protein AFP3-like [Populus alba x Populus x berolinensis]
MLEFEVVDNIHGDGISVPCQISKSGLFCKFSIKVIFTSVLFLVFALIIYQMAQTEKLQNIETQQQHNNISMFNNFPKDLLPRFISGNHCNHKLNGEEDVELSLGLSLNGRFGVDPNAKKINKSRPSSIAADFVNPLRENGNGSSFVVPNMESTNLSGTCSMPTETEEEWRKRKEMQSLRRMEAKRKRSEKQNFKAVKDKNRGEEDDQSENGTTGNHHQKEFLKSFNGLFGVAIEGLLTQAEVAPPPLLLTSQGTASSGMTEFESQPVKGMNKCVESRSPVSVQSLSECEQKSIIAPRLALAEKLGFPAGVAMEKNGSNKLIVAENGTKEAVRNVLEDMPCVSTKGDGSNGKRIEGFLYQYRKGEEVRIVCVCHGSFLSAAEFVKHAGDGDVEQPLQHIVVNPPPFL